MNLEGWLNSNKGTKTLIEMLGRYSFALPDAVQRGQLRPLRNPSEATEGYCLKP